jgi:predicted secreted protein
MSTSRHKLVLLVTTAVLVLAAALAGLVAGCGSSGTTKTAATTVTTKAVTTVTTAKTSYTTHYAPGQSPTTTTEAPTTTTTTAAPTTTTTIYVPKTVSIDASASGGVVDLNLRDKIKLSLAGNSTTGYNWAIVAPQVSVLVIRPMGEADYQAGSGIGQGGTYTWMFESIAQGQNPLVLEYRNPGEDLAAKTFSVTVNVDYVLATERQAGSSFNIQQGDVLGVQLAGNPSTGYAWAVTAIDQTKLRQAANPDYQPLTSQTGAGGNYTFRFQTYGQGSTILKLDYLPSGGGTPGKSFQITVNVQ